MEEMMDDMNDMTELEPAPAEVAPTVKPTPLKVLKHLQENIEAGEKWVKQGHGKSSDTREKQWERNAGYLRCMWDSPWDANDEESFQTNTIYANYHVKKPTLFFRNPQITAEATRPTFVRDADGNPEVDEAGQPTLEDNYHTARLLSLKINYELRDIGFKGTLKKVVGDNICPYGIGWTKWGFKDITVADHSNVRDPKYSYWCQRVDPRNLVYDYMATEPGDIKWTAERLVMTIKAAREYGFDIPLSHTAELPDFLKKRRDTVEESEGEVDENNLVVIWEYHDLVDKKIYWLLLSGGNQSAPKELKKVDWPYPFEESAYEPLVLQPDHDDIIGMSDVQPVEKQALALNRMRTMEVKHMDNFGTTIFHEEGAATNEEFAKYNKTPFGGRVTFKPGMMDKFQVAGTPPLGGDHYKMSEIHKDEIRTTLGITEYQQGSAGAASQKATIGTIVQNASNLRIEEQRDTIHDFVIANVKKLVKLLQAFSTEEEYINLSDEVLDEDFVDVLKDQYGFNPKIPFLKMSNKDIQGEYNFKFRIEDMIVVPKEVQLQSLINLFNVLSASPPVLQRFMETKDVDKVVEHMFELGGLDIERYSFNKTKMLSAEVENQMFLKGMEVPEPSKKDHDDEHILSHISRVIKPLEAQLSAVNIQAQQMMQQAQMMVQADPMMAEQNKVQTQQQVDEFAAQIQSIEMQIRRTKLHIQAHETQQKDKSTPASVRQAPPAPMPAPDQMSQMQATQPQGQPPAPGQ